MTGSNNPLLCVGGPKDGRLMSITGAAQQVHVREMARYSSGAFAPTYWDTPLPINAYSHVYHKATFAGETFLVHETLYQTPEYPRNVFALLKSNYKVFE